MPLNREGDRGDYRDPAQPSFGQPQTKYPTPNVADWTVIQEVLISPEKYRPLPYKSPHPDYETNGLILVWQGPVKAANNQIKVVRVYSTNGANEDWFNYSIKYSGDVITFPIYVRTYVELREDYVARPKAEPLKTVMLLKVTNGGTLYQSPPVVTISGGGGTGATAKAIMYRDSVFGLELTAAGQNFTSNPTVTIAAPGGAGVTATATAQIQPVGAVLVKEETEGLNSADQMASLFIRVHRIYEVLPGPWVPFTRYDDDLGPIQGRRRAVLSTKKFSLYAPVAYNESFPLFGTTLTYDPAASDPPTPGLDRYEWTDPTGNYGLDVLRGTLLGPNAGSVKQAVLVANFVDNVSWGFIQVAGVWTFLVPDGVPASLASYVYGGGLPPGDPGLAPDWQSVLFANQVAALTPTSKTTYEGRDGSAIVAWQIEENWTDGILTPFPPRVWDQYKDERGAVDKTTQLVPIAPDEETQEATLTRSGGVVTKIDYEAYNEFLLRKVEEHWVEVIINDKRTTSEFGGGILDETERTDEPGAQTPDTGFLIVGSQLKTKSPHEQTKITQKLSPDSATPTLELTLGGSAYSSAPAVGFAGGTGSAAAATAVLGKAINTITVTNGGGGYSTPPAIGFINGGGGGAFAIAVLGFALESITLTDGGGGYSTPPTVNIGGDGTGAAATAVLGKGVASIAVTAPGTGWTDIPVAVFTGDGTGAAANVVMGHPVLSVEVDNPGSGYTSAPAVSFTGGGGSGATATAVVQYTVASATITNPGTGFATAPAVGISGGGGSGAAATAALVEDFGISPFGNVTAAGSGYSTPPAIGFSGGGGSGAAATALLGRPVASIAVTNGGSGYATPPTVTINAPGEPWGSGATAHAVLTAGVVTSIVVDTPGADYTVALNVSFSGGGGSGAAASVTMGTGRVLDIIRTATGHGYTSNPTLSFSGGGGTGAAGTITRASLGMVVGSITITNAGSGYTSAPAIALTGGGGTGAAATAVLSASGSIKSITLTAPGTAFTSVPAIGLSGGAGSGAAAHAVLDLETLQVARIDVVDAGSGYTTAPTLSFSGGGGTGLTATATLASTGSVKSITVTTPGAGYTTAPITFSGGGGTGAAASSTLALTGSVKSVTVSNGGLFETTPTVSFSGDGSGAAGTAALASTGQVKRLILTTPGLYTVAPSVTFSGGGGSGAAAIYHIGDQLWPTLLGHHTDPTEGIVVNLFKTVIPAGTPHPGRGNYVDDEPHDRWKTIRIVSAVDLSTLPLPETYWTTHRYDFPPNLLAIEALWSDAKSKAVSAQAEGASVSVSSSSNAGIAIRKSSGFRGWAKAMVQRIWFFGPPPQSSIPLPFKIITASGSAVLTATNSRTHYALGDDGGVAFGDEFQRQIHEADIDGVLVGNYQILNPNHYTPPQSATARSGGGNVASATAFGTLCTMQVRLNPSTPAILVPGQLILAEAIPSKWRFGVWVLELIYVVVP